jgi:hypothetical protein
MVGEKVRDNQLAAIVIQGVLVLAYVCFTMGNSIALYGPNSLEPAFTCAFGEYEILGPAVRRIVALNKGQMFLKPTD